MNLGLNARLGYTAEANAKAGLLTYYVNDTFANDLAVGAIDQTFATPGPGRRTVFDTNGVLSLSGGAAVSGIGVSGLPRIDYPALILAPGMMLKVVMNHAGTSEQVGFGFTSSTSGAIGNFRIGTSAVLQFTLSGAVTIGTYEAGAHEYIVAHRCPGYYIVVKDPTTNKYRLLAHSYSFTSAGSVLKPALASRGASIFNCQLIQVPTKRWLPAPLASDGFGSAFGTTDGLGHPEGVSGGLGSGGSGVAWTQDLGTWSVVGGRAKPTSLASGGADATVNLNKTDVIAAVKFYRGTTGFLTLYLRYTDVNNHIRLGHDGTQVILIKRVSGVDTTLFTTANTFVAGAELSCQCIGTKFRVFYNNAAINGEQTMADAVLQTGTKFGIRTNDLGNEFDDFVAYAIGSDDEYSILSSF